MITILSIVGSQLIKKDKDGGVISAYVDRDGIQYKHTHLDIGMGFGTHAAAGTPHSHSTMSNETITSMNKPKQSTSGAFHQPVVDVMDSRNTKLNEPLKAQQRNCKKHTGKFGGFFSRLSNFRFSLKKGDDEKNKLKRKNESANAAGESVNIYGKYLFLFKIAGLFVYA